MHWLSHVFGLDDLSGPFYGFWSGAGSDLGELALLGAVAAAVKHRNCHVKGCFRIGKHPVADGLYRVCARHHPDVPDVVTVERVADAHARCELKGRTV